jgi:2-(1,2-epoxy-1,2-dihydrophenyl)acetyl-CoA isomerase
MADLVTVETSGGVARIQLNRPDAANALDLPLASALRDAVGRVADDGEAKAVLVSGAGQRFCAGGDIGSFVAAPDPEAYLHELALEADAAVRALADLAKPVVAVVHGAVAGAGLAVMLSCDIVVAETSTKFVFGYPGIGLTPDCGVSWLLPRAIGQQRALAFALGGQAVGADVAREWGLVAEVDADAHARGEEVAAALAAEAPRALGRTRRLLRDGWELDRAQAGRVEARTISEMVTGVEAQELLTRFLGR